MFDRFAIVEGYYLYMCDYHGGQGSKEYRLTGVFHKLRFRPSPMLDSDHCDEETKEVYDRLVSGEAKLRDRR